MLVPVAEETEETYEQHNHNSQHNFKEPTTNAHKPKCLIQQSYSQNRDSYGQTSIFPEPNQRLDTYYPLPHNKTQRFLRI